MADFIKVRVEKAYAKPSDGCCAQETQKIIDVAQPMFKVSGFGKEGRS